jgi:hypothetical protein
MRMYPLFDPGERALRSEAMVVRRKFAEPGIAASCQGKAPGESARGKVPPLRMAADRQVDGTMAPDTTMTAVPAAQGLGSASSSRL